MRSTSSENSQQLHESVLGQSFFLHLAGIEPYAFNGLSNEGVIQKLRELNIEILNFDSMFAEFIREFPFGEFSSWREHADRLREFEPHIGAAIMSQLAGLQRTGVLGGFDPLRQVTVNGPVAAKTWFSNPEISELSASKWWNFPDVFWTIQTLNQRSEQLPLDDAIVAPRKQNIFNVSVIGKPIVYEIGGAEDWLWLVEKWPKLRTVDSSTKNPINRVDFLRQSQYFEPNYELLRGEFDGVYLSPSAYLALAYRDTQIANGSWTTLLGWSPGATYWFREGALRAN